MSKAAIQFVILFALLILVQVLIFNNLVLFNCAVCFIFIYFIIRLPLSLSTNWLLTLAFLMGLIIDLFSDTPGVNSLSAVLLAISKRRVAFSYIPLDDKTKGETPCLSTMGWAAYAKYLLTLTAIFCVVSFTIEFFNFADLKQILLMAGASTLFTFPVLLSTDCIIDSSHAKRL